MDKQFYDENAFYVEQKKWGTWDSYTPEGKCIITALTESDCVSSTRFYLKILQEKSNGKKIEAPSYSGEMDYKL
jgi:hypothetical protein